MKLALGRAALAPITIGIAPVSVFDRDLHLRDRDPPGASPVSAQ